MKTILKCKDNSRKPEVVPKLKEDFKVRPLRLKVKKESCTFIKEFRRKVQECS